MGNAIKNQTIYFIVIVDEFCLVNNGTDLIETGRRKSN